jgi:hypothetical protein
LKDIPSPLVHGAIRADDALLARVELSNRFGAPRCARVNPPAVTWERA